MNFSIRIIVLLCLFQVSCKSNQVTSTNKEHNISEVKVEAITRGKKENYLITQNNLAYKSITRGNENIDNVTLNIEKNKWNRLVALINNVNLNTINNLKAPSTNFQFDGDLATTLTIVTKDSTYTSSVFDKQNPPKEISEIVKYIYSLNEE